MRTLEEQTTAARQVLRDVFGFDAFRPGQEAAIEARCCPGAACSP